MAELTRGQKAARTRARNKAVKAQAEAEAKPVNTVRAIDLARGATVSDINAMYSEANTLVTLADKQNLSIAYLSVAKEFRGQIVTLTLLDGEWLISAS